MSLPNDAYGHTVDMTSDGVNDTYSVGGSYAYTFPTGTTQNAAYISMAIQINLAQFNIALTQMINNHYDLDTRMRWIALYLECEYFSRPNRLAYVAQLLTWGDSISVYTSAYLVELMAMTDTALIAAKRWDYSILEAADPKVNLIACMQIVG